MKNDVDRWQPNMEETIKIEAQLKESVLGQINNLISFKHLNHYLMNVTAIPNGRAAFIIYFETDVEWEAFKGSGLEDKFKLICKKAVHKIAVPLGASKKIEVFCGSNSSENEEREIKRVGWQAYIR